jgi:microsomal dipeptidase-like Zn-dependent dipeptidase
MRRMQGQYGKVVWLPTIDADHHVKFFQDAAEGIKVVEGDKPGAGVREIMKICADNGLILHTGHGSADEVLVLDNTAQQVGLRKFVVTHALFSVVDMNLEQLKHAAQLGAIFELAFLGTLMGPTAHLPFMMHWKRVSAEENAAAVKAVGAQHFVIGTDLGQTGNPSHPDGYQLFVQQLEKAGLSKDDIHLMTRGTPGKLLGIAT